MFVAFNFTISNDLPRLGYLTFLDTVMVCPFIMTSLIVMMNVYLRRLETSGREALAHRLDRYLMWGYPLSWLAAVVVLIVLFQIW